MKDGKKIRIEMGHFLDSKDITLVYFICNYNCLGFTNRKHRVIISER